MKSRCTFPSRNEILSTMEEEITYDPRYNDFEEFKLDFFQSFQQGLEIDRINVDGNYVKENIRSPLQNRNKSET